MAIDSGSHLNMGTRNLHSSRVVDIVDYFRKVYSEVPGVRFSPAEASLLSGVEESTCRAIMMAFVDASVLQRESRDTFVARR